MKKRLLTLLLAVIMVCSMLTTAVYAASNPFKDVLSASYYYEPVLWAVDKGITTGMTATKFMPYNTCKRGEVVTFLWRLAGEPKPENTDNPFTDVPEEKFYYYPVLWAVEQGITNGTTDTTFEPESYCSRAQVVTFLWRYAGKPAPKSDDHTFVDIDESMFYFTAMLWALEKGITTGATTIRFEPNGKCERCQIVTFLYRASGESFDASETVLEFSGTGSKTIENIDLPAGEYYCEYIITNPEGDSMSHTSVKLKYGSYNYEYMLLVNGTLAPCGDHPLDETIGEAINDGTLIIDSEGSWVLRFKKITDKSTMNMRGTGDTVTGKFTAQKSTYQLHVTHDEDNAGFYVDLFPANGAPGTEATRIYNGSDILDDTVTVTLTPGQEYYLYVHSTAQNSADWTVDFGTGEAITGYALPTVTE